MADKACNKGGYEHKSFFKLLIEIINLDKVTQSDKIISVLSQRRST